MSLRRCPSCWNLVERESETCPICGRSFIQALVTRAVPWMIGAGLLVWTMHHFVTRGH